MGVTIAVPKNDKLGSGYGPYAETFVGADPNRPSGMTAGSWVGDFVALRKMVTLCPHCIHKFNPRKVNYEVWRRDLYSVGKCDDCNQWTQYLRAFIHESLHADVGEWQSPRRGRWARS